MTGSLLVQPAQPIWQWLSERVIQPSCLPKIKNLDAAQLKINSIRVIVGLIALYRTGLITYAAWFYFPAQSLFGVSAPPEFLFGCFIMLLLTMFTVGLATPLSVLLLLLTYNLFDTTLATKTLGSNVFTLLLLLFLFSNSGSRLSWDARILQGKASVLKTGLTRLYGVLRFPDRHQLSVIYFLIFLAFAGLNLGALLFHLNDPYWFHGQTVGVAMTNSYLSRHYEFFRWFEQVAPWLFQSFSVGTGLCHMVFQLLMIPLMYFRWGFRYIVAWGLLFFLMSQFCLQLSYLPLLEMALWALIFIPEETWGRLWSRFTMQPASQPVALTVPCSQRPFFWKTLLGFSLAAGLLLVLTFPMMPRIKALNPWGKTALYYLGLGVPVVFNHTDLSMGDHWPVIQRVYADKPPELIPFNNRVGGREAYHRFDELYFGNSLYWRRAIIPRDPFVFNRTGEKGYELLRKVIAFDYRLNRHLHPIAYQVTIFTNQASQPDLPPEERYQQRPLLKIRFPLPQ